MLVLKSQKKGRKISVVVTSFSNDGSARPTMLLKTQSSSNILTDQVRKLQNSFFKEHLRKAAPVLQQAHYLRASHEKCS